jgi:GTP-binding protein
MGDLNLNRTEFIKSAVSPEGFLRDALPRVAFAGKSNVGKSSVINRLLNRKNFARVGDTPGKTVHVNYFKIDGRLYFIDLPGYGYAAVSKGERDRWGALMEDFFAEPEQITLGVLIVDSRHAPTADDVTMTEWFKSTGRPFVVVANKADKLNATEKAANPGMIRAALSLDEGTPLLLFSAEKGLGRDALLGAIRNIL